MIGNLIGKGLQIERSRGCDESRPRIRAYSQPPSGKGLQIDRSRGNGLQIDSTSRRIPITELKRKPKFLDYPISNFDIIEWIKYLGIKNFKGVFSRDNLKGTIKKPECAVINLDDSIGPGTHWVYYYNNYYFNPFGMPPPLEVKKYINNIKYNDIQYQDTRSNSLWILLFVFLEET